MATMQRREFFGSHLSSGNTGKKDDQKPMNEGEKIVVAHELLRKELAESRARLEEQFKD